MEPITLVTGQPGHGKSLYSISMMREAKADGFTCYAIGYDGLSEDAALPSPVPVEEWFKLPPGSALFVDEAHKFLPKPGKGPEPEWITKLAEVRHAGIRLVLITQDPRSVHHFLRRRAGVHFHLERKTGHNFATLWTFRPVADDPQDYHARQKAQSKLWRYPKQDFSVYHSAELHAVKTSIPWKFYAAPLILVGLIACIVYAVTAVQGWGEDSESSDTTAAELSASLDSPLSSLRGLGGMNRDNARSRWSTVEEFVRLHAPLIEGVPWSAPIFAERSPTTVPDIHCIIVGDSTSWRHNCRCYSEQITPVQVDRQFCRDAARGGVYNPYRAVRAPGAGQGRPMGEVSGASPMAAPATTEQHSPPRTRAYAAPPPVPAFSGVR